MLINTGADAVVDIHIRREPNPLGPGLWGQEVRVPSPRVSSAGSAPLTVFSVRLHGCNSTPTLAWPYRYP